MSQSTSTHGSRSQWWLAAGAALGLLIAAAGVIGDAPDGADLPEGAVARVGNSLIRNEEYARLLAGVEADRREPIDDALRRHVLDRMIDEELLVQRAVELGLVDVDRRVRADLVSAMIQSIVADADEIEPSDADLRSFYDENAGFFTSPGRLHARQIFFRTRGDDARGPGEERAARAAQRLAAGDDFETVRRELGDREISPLPDTMLPALKVREYIGPTALRSLMELDVGATSAPVRSGTGLHILRLVDREAPHTPPYEQVADQVRAEWRRRQGDRALRAYLDGLRDEIAVTVAEGDEG